MKVTYVKADVDTVLSDGSKLPDGWKYVCISDPATGELPTDAKGRSMVWIELNTTEGWGYILDLDAFEQDPTVKRFVRVEAAWVRLLEMTLELPDGYGDGSYDL